MVGIAAWIVAMAVDKRIVRTYYDDVEVLGMAVVRGRSWLPAGLALHTLNGALFGMAYARWAEPRLPGPGWLRGLLAAEAENTAVVPLTPLVDRLLPAVRDGRTGRMATVPALAQAAWRHGVFGIVLGTVYAWLRDVYS